MPETSQTLERGLRVLHVLASSPGGMSITELAAEVKVNRTVVYRLVATLEQAGLARRDSSGRLHVGLGVLALARGLQPELLALAGPVLRALAEDLGSTAHLTIADGGEALAIAVVEPSWTDFHVAYRVGARHPLDRGAAGKAILLGRTVGPGGSAEQTSVHTQGELQAGARGVAAPVLGVDGLEAYIITGAGDMWCRVVARSNADLQRVIDAVLSDSGIVRSSTVIALATQIPYRVLPLLDVSV
jgi:DNA-binding IclR family transcriptional regulator